MSDRIVGCLSHRKQGENHTKEPCDMCVSRCVYCYALVMRDDKDFHEEGHKGK